MNTRTLLTTLLLVTLPLAGCINPAGEVDRLAAEDAQSILPHLEITDDHDHSDPAQHRAAWNMEQLGWATPAPDMGSLGRYNHVVVNGDHAYLSTYLLEADGKPGMAVFDISGDAPVLVSTLATPDLTPIDVHISEDAKYAVLGGHRDNRFTLPGDLQTCTGTGVFDVCTPFVPGGVVLVDITDPASPQSVATYTSAPSGAHTAKVHLIDGDHYVFIASYGFSYASRLVSQVEILRLESLPTGLSLVPVARYQADELSGNNGDARVFVHDMWIEEHMDGRLLMYVSYWDGGVVIADVSDPTNPTEVAAWKDFDIGLYGNIHFARPVGVIGERHITFAAPEFGSAPHAGEAYVLDTTDPADPQLLAKWVLPGDPHNDQNYRFSPHNFDPRGTQLVYAHYHGGIWVLDLADPSTPVVKGYATPTVPEGIEYESGEDAPNIWAAQWTDKGTIIASDIGIGLFHYALLEGAGDAPPYEAFLG